MPLISPLVRVGVVAAAIAVVPACAAHAADRVFWGGYGATNPAISFANLDGSGGGNLNTANATVSEPYGLAIDLATNRIFWANDSGNRISYARLDGSGGGDLDTTGAAVHNPEGVAIDTAHRRIYWTNPGGSFPVSFANLAGGGGGNLNTSGATASNPRGLAIDPGAGRVYWVNGSAPKGIEYARLDNSGGNSLPTGAATFDIPNAVALDVDAGRVYWTDQGRNKISFARLDGTGGAGDLNTSPLVPNGPLGLGIDVTGNRIYWANDSGNTIAHANRDGTGGGATLSTGAATVDGPAFATLLKSPAPADAPAVSGGGSSGSRLSCTQGSWGADFPGAFLFRIPQSFAFTWSRNGAALPGASSSTLVARRPGSYRCTVAASNAAGTTSQASGPHTIFVAALSSYRIKPASFLAATSGPSALASRRKKRRGARVTFRLNEAATVSFKVKRRLTGRRVKRGKARRCVRRTRANRRKRRCTRLVTVRGGFTRAGKAGKNSFRFTGRLRGRRLRPGRYVLVATPRAAGAAGRSHSVKFRIKRPPRRRRAT